MQTKGLTQKMVVSQGGPSQSVLSRMINNHNAGPSVDSFVQAVQGLGMPISQFFAELEHAERSFPRREDPDVITPHAPSLTDAELLAVIRRLIADTLGRPDDHRQDPDRDDASRTGAARVDRDTLTAGGTAPRERAAEEDARESPPLVNRRRTSRG
jgi:hypothetical protein